MSASPHQHPAFDGIADGAVVDIYEIVEAHPDGFKVVGAGTLGRDRDEDVYVTFPYRKTPLYIICRSSRTDELLDLRVELVA